MKSQEVVEGTPKVSVCIVTYNQEKYIRECLQSLVEQECSFEFEIIVGDDASKDNTPKIIEEYAKKYPKIIKAIFNSKNAGPCKNYLNVHRAATGEYVCHCDGDDYFFAGKLQAQSDAMDSNRLASMAIHKMLYLSETNDERIGEYPESAPLIFDLNYLIRRLNFIPHSAKMYRRSECAIWPLEEEFLDFQLHVNDLARGACIYLPTTYGVYRHGVGVSADMGKRKFIERLVMQALKAAENVGASKVSLGIARFKISALKIRRFIMSLATSN